MKKLAISFAVLCIFGGAAAGALLGGVAALAQQQPATPPAPAAAPAQPPAPPTPRQEVMRANNREVQAINEIVIGVMDPAGLKAHTQALVDNGGKIAVLFAPGTDQNDPRIKPELWSNPAGFKAANDKFIANVKKVTAAIPDRLAMATAMKEVQADCGACHTAFRVAPAQPEGRGRGRGRGAAPADAAAAAPAAANN